MVVKSSNQGPPATPGRVNDGFLEPFLTERPGSSDTEEASSSLRTEPSGEPSITSADSVDAPCPHDLLDGCSSVQVFDETVRLARSLGPLPLILVIGFGFWVLPCGSGSKRCRPMQSWVVCKSVGLCNSRIFFRNSLF